MAAATDPRISHIERLAGAIRLPIARWDRQQRMVFCNDDFLTWAGRTREALLGGTPAQLYGEAVWQIAGPSFAQAFAGHAVSYERQLQHGPWTGHWVRVQVLPDADDEGRIDAVFTIGTDIHADVQAREALSGARVRLDRFTDTIPYPLTYVDRDFVLRFVNKAYTEATQQKAESLLGQHIGRIRGARRWAEHEPYFRSALLGKPVHYTRLVTSLPQGPRWMRTSYVPDLDGTGAVVGLYTVTIDVHELTVAQEKLKRRVERDTLTDVLSRRTMMDRIEAALADAARTPLALFFVDLDGFKSVNDRHGHREGDAVLVAVAAALQQAVRAEDAVGRFGGDEFLVLAPVRDALGAQALALHMLEAISSVAVTGTPAAARCEKVSASIGYALARADAQHPLALLQLADDAMYAAKRAGKNCVVHCASLSCEATR